MNLRNPINVVVRFVRRILRRHVPPATWEDLDDRERERIFDAMSLLARRWRVSRDEARRFLATYDASAYLRRQLAEHGHADKVAVIRGRAGPTDRKRNRSRPVLGIAKPDQ